MYMLNMVIILIVMYCNVVTAIDKIPTYLLRFNTNFWLAILKKPWWSWRRKVMTWSSPSDDLPRALRHPMTTTTSAMAHLSPKPPGPLVPKMRHHSSHHSNQVKVGVSFSTLDRPCAQISKGDEPILDLEDHTSIETSHNGQGQFSPLIDIGNGKEVPKARILQELERASFSKVPGLTDCLNQCTGLLRYSKTSALPDLACDITNPTSNTHLSIGNPATTIVQCEGQFFLAIIQVNEILFNTSPVQEIMLISAERT